MRIRTGDEVEVLIGKDKGKKGKVEKVFPGSSSVLVAGVNLYKKHMKPKGKTLQGGIIDITKPLPVSNVAVVCPKCKLPSKIGYKISTKSKIRICKKCNQALN